VRFWRKRTSSSALSAVAEPTDDNPMLSEPHWNGTDQQRSFAFTGDELRYTAASSTANRAETAELVWKWTR
jgi:hypothetical protein